MMTAGIVALEQLNIIIADTATITIDDPTAPTHISKHTPRPPPPGRAVAVLYVHGDCTVHISTDIPVTSGSNSRQFVSIKAEMQKDRPSNGNTYQHRDVKKPLKMDNVFVAWGLGETDFRS